MPIQTYQCNACGLRFRKRTRTGVAVCSCGVELSCDRKNLSVGFGANVNGVDVQDTGMESLDLNYDRVIGEDARQKWEMIYARRKDKWDMINSVEGSTGYDLLRDDDGSYIMNSTAGSVLKENRDYGMDKIKQSKNKPPTSKEQ